MFTSLIPTLFYFSVWELGIAGHELALLSTLSPMLLGLPIVRKWVQTREGLTLCRVMEVLGLGAYALDAPGQRLCVVVVSVAVGGLGRVSIWAGGRDSAEYQGIRE
jgi:hypothetical protein